MTKNQKKINDMDNLGFFFGAYLGNFLGFILGPDRPKRGQDEPKRAIRSSKSQKAAFSKTLKNLKFFSVFGSRGSQENLKRPEKAPKRHPKRHPKVVQKLVKKLLKSEPKNGQTKMRRML